MKRVSGFLWVMGILVFLGNFTVGCTHPLLVEPEANITQEIQEEGPEEFSARGTSSFLSVKVWVNGKVLNYTDQGEVFDSHTERTLVPLNQTLRRCGFTVTWNQSNQQAICVRERLYPYFHLQQLEPYCEKEGLVGDRDQDLHTGVSCTNGK